MRLIALCLAVVLTLGSIAFPFVALSAEATPAATAADWKANAATAAAANNQQAEATAATAPSPFWSHVTVWATAAAGLALVVARNLSASNPLARAVVGVAGTIYDAVVPHEVRADESRQVALAKGMLTVVHLLDELPAGTPVDQIKQALSQRLPSECLDIINQLITAREVGERTQPLPVVTG